VDVKRNRIGLTMRMDDEPGQAAPRAGGERSDHRGGQRHGGHGGGGGGGKGFGGGKREPEVAGAMAAAFAKLKR
jgi:uncharacterized protein